MLTSRDNGTEIIDAQKIWIRYHELSNIMSWLRGVTSELFLENKFAMPVMDPDQTTKFHFRECAL